MQAEQQVKVLVKAGKDPKPLILKQDEPLFRFRYHPDYLQSILDYRDLNGGKLPFQWDSPETINVTLLAELRDYQYIVAYRKEELRVRGGYTDGK